MRTTLKTLLVLGVTSTGISADEVPRLPSWVTSSEVTSVSGYLGTYVGPSGRWVGVTERGIEFRGVRRGDNGGTEEARGSMVLRGPLTLAHVSWRDGEVRAWRFVGGREERRTCLHIRRRAGTRATAWFVNEDDGVIQGAVSLSCTVDFDAIPTRVGTRLVPTPVILPEREASPAAGRVPSY